MPWQVHERGTVYRQLSAQPPHRFLPLKKNLNHFCLDCHSVFDNIYRSLTMFSALAAVCTVDCAIEIVFITLHYIRFFHGALPIFFRGLLCWRARYIGECWELELGLVGRTLTSHASCTCRSGSDSQTKQFCVKKTSQACFWHLSLSAANSVPTWERKTAGCGTALMCKLPRPPITPASAPCQLLLNENKCRPWVYGKRRTRRIYSPHAHGRRKRGHAGDLTPQLFMWGILICIPPRKT